MKILSFMMFIAIAWAGGCKKSPEQGRVDLQQIEVDDSTDYRYIFRDAIREQEYMKNKSKKKDF